jgi:hypothetical protein
MHFSATEGLSPYIEWLHRTLRKRRVRVLLHPHDIANLERKLVQAKTWLERLHLRGQVSPRKLTEMRRIGQKIEATLLALVPSDHPLYRILFTSRQLVESLERAIEKAHAAAQSAGEGVRRGRLVRSATQSAKKGYAAAEHELRV